MIFVFTNAGFVDLETFLGDSRPPSNHSDYQPLIDYCKANSLPVVAANCPRRYSRMASRQGRQRLQECAGSGSGCGPLLPPLPYAGASEEYGRAFAEVMGIVRGQGEVPRSMLDAQSLWDAAMAHSIHKVCSRDLLNRSRISIDSHRALCRPCTVTT